MSKPLFQALSRSATRPSASLGSWLGKTIRLTDGAFWGQFIGGQSSSGKSVSVDTAMRVSAVWACVRLIAETIATLPLGLYRRLPDGSREADTGHPLYSVLAVSPNEHMSPVQFWEAMLASMLLRGNAFAQIHRSGSRIVALSFLLPHRMRLLTENGVIRYFYSFSDGERELSAAEVLHIPAFSLDGRIGLSPISYGADIIGSAMSADDAANGTFKNGMMPTVAFKVDRVLKPDQRDDFRKYVETVSGAMNAGKSPVLEAGVTPESIGINPTDAQLLETRSWSVEEVCRFFRVPPWMVGHTEKNTSWGSGLEQQVIGFLTFSLSTWLRRIEKAVLKQLLRPEERLTHYAEFALEGLLRADSAARASFYSTMVQNGIYTRDDCRVRENLPRRGGNADVLTAQTNLAPLDALGQTSDGQAARAALQNWLTADPAKE
ncbi:phage portal protein [Stutzerimonas nitrititolerans]|uniref:phage portal protein n=1 Tax=Stutzerimonas nitrititolerans TaxID=2482751 RepID=UPI0028A8FEC5|nr:phage portal protein [Stutzerimonas nitrititolerans]